MDQHAKTNWAFYNPSADAPFTAKDIFDSSMYTNGIVPVAVDDAYAIEIKGSNDPSKAIVLKAEYGKCYEIKFLSALDGIRVAKVSQDPCTLKPGSVIAYTADDSLRYCEGIPEEADRINLMYVCRKQNEYLVIYTGSTTASVYIGERTMLHDADTAGPWFIPKTVGSITNPDGTFGNYQWTSDQVINNLYEPYRNQYPEYISRTILGKDQSGTYDMYGYVYTPKAYKATMFLTGGMHANEESAYFSLAKLMQLICDATPEDTLLYTLRENVRFIVVPIINVWGVSQNHDETEEVPRKRIRRNSENVDLNRDFGEVSQQESKNILAFFEAYAAEIDIAMDFHNARTSGISMWYNFINYSENSAANYKTTNHMYHRLMDLGLCEQESNIQKIPGSYYKKSMYIEGRLWNEFKVPTITVEHIINSSFPYAYSSEGVTLAVETFGNFIVQNGLFFIQKHTQQ